MNAVPDKTSEEEGAELPKVDEKDSLVEIGRLSETQGDVFGSKGDGGFGVSYM